MWVFEKYIKIKFYVFIYIKIKFLLCLFRVCLWPKWSAQCSIHTPALLPPLKTNRFTSLPTGSSFSISTTCAWLSVCTFCRLISFITSPFNRPWHHCSSRIIFTFCPSGQSAMAKPNPPGPFTIGTLTSSGCSIPVSGLSLAPLLPPGRAATIGRPLASVVT